MEEELLQDIKDELITLNGKTDTVNANLVLLIAAVASNEANIVAAVTATGLDGKVLEAIRDEAIGVRNFTIE